MATISLPFTSFACLLYMHWAELSSVFTSSIFIKRRQNLWFQALPSHPIYGSSFFAGLKNFILQFLQNKKCLTNPEEYDIYLP
jgi:hypothetical protein